MINKKAFTLLELIFVIVVIGIIAGVGSSVFKPTYLLDDTNYIVAKIKEAQFSAIGYEGNSDACITFSKVALEDNNYKLHIDEFDDGTICFDSKGRPHESSFDGTLLSSRKTITLSYGNSDKTVNIEPITGYVIVN